jgi:hypothetical protein
MPNPVDVARRQLASLRLFGPFFGLFPPLPVLDIRHASLSQALVLLPSRQILATLFAKRLCAVVPPSVGASADGAEQDKKGHKRDSMTEANGQI